MQTSVYATAHSFCNRFDSLDHVSDAYLADRMARAGVPVEDALWYLRGRRQPAVRSAADLARIDRIAVSLSGI